MERIDRNQIGSGQIRRNHAHFVSLPHKPGNPVPGDLAASIGYEANSHFDFANLAQ